MALVNVNSDNNGDRPVLTHTANGASIVAYRNNNSGTYEVHVCENEMDGSSFDCTTLDTNTGYPSVHCNYNTDNLAVIVYPKLVGDVYELHYSESSDEGITWSTPLQITVSSTYDQWNPTVRIDDTGNVIIVYESRDSDMIPRIFMLYKLAGTNDWVGPFDINTNTVLTETPTTEILNGDFENWTAASLDDWSVLGTATDTEETTIVKNGTSSLRAVGATDNTTNVIAQSVTPESTYTQGDRFLLRGWFYAQTGTAKVDIRTPHGEEVVFETRDTGRWEPWSIIVETHNFNLAVNIRLYADDVASITFYDNFELLKLTSATQMQHTPSLYIDNDDFVKGHAAILYTQEDNAGGYEVRFKAATPLNGADITENVGAIRVSRDKEFKTGRFGAGDFSLVLDNTERVFSNEKVSSPYYKRFKSGLEFDIDMGVRVYSGTGALDDDSQWDTELFPMIKGTAAKFAISARNETMTVSGRDRAERFMSYRNFTSKLYETQTAAEIITDLANTDHDLDGFGDIDPNRPDIAIVSGLKQQTLTSWDDKLISGLGTSQGDAGDSNLTGIVQKTIDITTYHTNASACIGAWVDRSTEGHPLYTISTRASGGGNEEIELHKWSGWKNPSSTLTHDNSWDIITEFGSTDLVTGGVISVSPYDSDHDCVWIQYAEEYSSGDALRLKIYHFDFKNQTATEKLEVFTNSVWTNYIMKAGAIFYDRNNQKLFFANTHQRNHSGGGDWPRYGVCSVGGTASNPTLTLDFYSDLQDDTDGTSSTGDPETYFPSLGICFGPFYYFVLGYQYDSGTPYNYSSLAAIRASDMLSYSQTKITDFPVNTALCWVTHPSTASPKPDWSSTYQDLATGEAFFDNSVSQRTAQLGLDYDDDFVYMFTSDDQTEDWEFKDISAGIQVRRLATRTFNLSKTNVQGSEHLISNGYLDNDTDTIWYSSPEIYVENLANTAAQDLNEDPEYVDDQWTQSGTGILTVSGTGLAFRDVPEDDYEIHLETGEIKFMHLFDKQNSLYASYDYKHAAPYAWFEDTSIWEAIQEVATSGDYVCYVDENGQLVFRDRFIYHHPLASTNQAYLNAGSPGTWTGTPFDIEDIDGVNVTNIIPGLEFVTSTEPDKDTGAFLQYRRRSYTLNGTTTIGEDGDYDIDYDTGKIGFVDGGDIKDEERLTIYYYARDYVFEYAYDSNIEDLNYSWGSDTIANRITVKGERFYPSTSPISIREVFVVNPGDTVISTKFANIKQLDVDSVTGLTQNQYDAFAEQWREQASNHKIDLEFRNPLIGDTARARNAGNAIKIRAIPTTSPASWDEGSTAFDTIPTSEWVGIGWKINWDEPGDTGAIPNPNSASSNELNITGITVDSDGIRITIDHLEKSQRQFFIQLEIEGYTLTRTQRFTALHENYASMQKYYTRSFEVTNRFISNLDIAKRTARNLSRFLSEERPEVTISVLGSPHIQLEDVVAVRELNSGLAGDYFEVVGISDEMTQDRYITKIRLRKICEVTSASLHQNDPVGAFAGGFIGKAALPIETFVDGDFKPITK